MSTKNKEMTAVSLFAGVGGFDLALERNGVKVVASVEIDKKASAILAKHFPNSQIFGDVSEVTGEQLIAAGFDPSNGIITGGFPCQDVSVAGKRAGLAGARTGLFWEIIRLLKETKAQYFILENVPGLLSSNNGRDMGTVLGALAECGYGVAYRVLDAQYFGVPQRRRRVFIVGSLGDSGRTPSEILAIAEGRAGYLEASEQKGKTVAGDLVGSLAASDYKFPQQQQAHENKIVIQPQLSNGHAIANCLPAELYHRGTVVNQDINAGHLVIQDSFVKSRRAQTIDDDETWIDGKVSTTLNAFDNGGESRATVLIIDGTRVNDVGVYEDGIVPTVVARYGTGGNNVPAVFPIQGTVIGRSDTSGPQGKGYADNGEPMFTQTKTDVHAVAINSTVRRLTPMECERLQGFPDGFTEGQADSNRYKQMGNAVAVPVVEWIVARLVAIK
jgi:DNA-cytosine methyltransferase